MTLYWIGLTLAWITSIWNLADIWRRHRADKRQEKVLIEEAADHLGLTPLQMQVALDESSAAFFNRIDALKKTTKGDNT